MPAESKDMDPKAPFADCNSCPLKHEHFVPGYGRRQAGRVIVGLAPGDEEVRQGKPFMGKAGERLNKAIGSHWGLDRSRIYITNTVLCRPPDHKPTPDAVSACFKRLVHEIQGTMPRQVLALGEIAGQTLTGDRLPVSKMRLKRYRFPGLDECELRVTYHPSGVIMNPHLGDSFDEDMGWLMQPEAAPFEPGREAGIRDLCEQGYSAYEIGQIVGLTEARVRRILGI